MVNLHANHIASVLPNGLVLIAAGLDNAGGSANAEIYNPATGIWSTTSPGCRRSRAIPVVQLNDGRVLGRERLQWLGRLRDPRKLSASPSVTPPPSSPPVRRGGRTGLYNWASPTPPAGRTKFLPRPMWRRRSRTGCRWERPRKAPREHSISSTAPPPISASASTTSVRHSRRRLPGLKAGLVLKSTLKEIPAKVFERTRVQMNQKA